MGALIGSVGELGSQRSPIPQDQQATLRPRGLSFCRVALAEAGECAGGCSLGAVGEAYTRSSIREATAGCITIP
jgi:hypothetical protein